MATEFISNSWLMPTNANAEANRVSNYSLDFDGTSQYISINSSILSAAGDMTVSAWVKFNDTTSLQGIFESANYYTTGFNGGFGLRANGTGLSAAFSNSTSLNDYNIEPAGFTIGNWFHVAFTFNNTSKLGTYYVDGSSIGTYTFNSACDNADLVNGAELGRVVENSGYILNGNLTEVSIFDYSLSASQVTELYGTGSAIGNPMAITNGRKPVAYYPLGNSAFNGEFLVPNGAEQDYVFDFTADYITMGNVLDKNGSDAFSVSCWINYTGSGTMMIVSKQNASNYGYLLYSANFSGVKLSWFPCISAGGSIQVRTSNSYNDGKWHLVTATYDGSGNASGAKIYVDNTLDTNIITDTFTGTSSSISPFQISARNGTSFPFTGKISNASIFNTALPATGTESIESLYNYGTPPNIASYSNLQAWYELDASATFDGSNWSIPDASSNSNTGTSSGMTAANLILSDLVINQPYDSFSLAFDGSNDFIQIPYNANLTPQTGNFTVSAWVNTDNLSGWHPIWSTLNLTSSVSTVAIHTFDTKIRVTIGRPTSGWALLLDSTQALNTSTWYHIAVTFNFSGNAQIYINGSADNSGVIGTHSTTWNTGDRYIGEGEGFWDGRVSNLSIYNSELSATQVSTLYNEHKPFDLNTFEVTPVSWWRLGSVNSSYNSTSSEWTILDEIGTNNGTGSNLGPAQTALSDGVGATGSGLSSGMSSGTNRTGNAPYSENNAVSYNMSVTAKSTSVPT
jgi:hypothetical protein